MFAWTDAKVVLSWLSSHPRKWKQYVANRTSEILELIPREKWNYVPSKDNPADIASRGVNHRQLIDCSLWWHGPTFLLENSATWPKSRTFTENLDALVEEKSSAVCCNYSDNHENIISDLFYRFSSLCKITSIIAYCERFINHCKQRVCNSKFSGELLLNYTERQNALLTIIKLVQSLHFSSEIDSLQKNKAVPCKSPLISLTPFIDEHGVLRVGGRLQNSSLPFSAKHPIILPAAHKISSLLIKEYHVTHLHAGTTLLSNVIRQKFWIIGGKRLIRSIINKCVICVRYRRPKTEQLMGNLPEARVTQQRPFFSTGLDYAGPVVIKFNKGRGAKTTKGYIAIFVCLSTKAVHCEAVSDYTADAFIAALRRFSARRGAPRHIYCDNGTNFVGARRKLMEIQKFLLSVNKSEIIAFYLSQSGTEFHFIPPSSPHFGGLWEAAVKSMKFHLMRVIGETILTFEELTTLLTQIEACLNSRPLTVVNEDSENRVLTPSHLLTGDIILSPSDNCYPPDNTMSYSSRWNMIQSMRKGFWNSWHRDYLSTLQPRGKWQVTQLSLQPDDIVLLREDKVPPGIWPLGKVVETHPGKDGLTRVVTVKTVNGCLKRPIAKLIKLISSCQE